MKDFFKVSASSLEKIMRCAGSLRFEDLPKFDQRADGAEGEAAGEYLAYLVSGTVPIPDKAKNGIFFDGEMKRHARNCMIHIPSIALYEVNCSWFTDRTGVKISCRFDFSWVDDQNVLHIVDYKYGWGIHEVEKNWQLIAYAIGEVIRRGVAFDTIALHILQPRPHHEDGPYRTVTITYDQLLQYKEEIEVRMEQMKAGYAGLASGGHCRFCDAGKAGRCPAINKAFNNAIHVIMEDFKNDYLTEQDVADGLDMMESLKDLLKIKKDHLEELAKVRIKENKLIPNYSMSDSYGHRKFKPEISIASFKAVFGHDISETVMLSPAEVANRYGLPDMLMDSLTTRPFLGTKLKRKDAGKAADKIFNNKKG